MLIASNISKQFGTLKVLKGVDLQVHKGEMVCITGSSGAGKSTFLHIAGTLDNADGGSITIDGTNTNNLTGKKLSAFRNSKIGFVFQFHHLLPEFSALENICIPAWIAGISKKEANMRAQELLERVGLQARTQHKPNELSGGEQQRVAIARALINKPALLLADEPTGNLDSSNSKEIFDLLKSCAQDLQQTVIMVTHNLELAQQSSRIIQMRDGKVVS